MNIMKNLILIGTLTLCCLLAGCAASKEAEKERKNEQVIGAAAGTLQKQLLMDYFKDYETKDGKVDYVLLEEPANHQAAKLKTKCSQEVMEQNGLKIKKLSEDIIMWKREAAEQKMEGVLKSQGDSMDY